MLIIQIGRFQIRPEKRSRLTRGLDMELTPVIILNAQIDAGVKHLHLKNCE